MKLSSKKLKKMVEDQLYLRRVMVHEIRYMGEDLLLEMNARRIEKAIRESKNENHA